MVAQRFAPRVRVFVAGREELTVRCLDVILGSSADALPTATLEVQPEGRKPGRREFLNSRFTAFNQAEVEVLIGNEVVHWGKALAQPVQMDGTNGDRVTLVSRMENHHFGGPLNSTVYFHPYTRMEVALHLSCVFNPDVDGETIGNMGTHLARDSRANLFFHHEASRTQASRTYNRTTAAYWTLPKAVHYLCSFLNPDERYVLNPTQDELNAVLPNDTSLLRNFEIPYGEYLPRVLDRILTPFGFGWTVEFVGRGRRKVRIFSRGTGPPRVLKMQPPGSIVDVNATNLEELSLVADNSSKAFNGVQVMGDHDHVEGTFVLVPGWPRAYDDYPTRHPEQLVKDCEEWKANPVLRDVWRKWVLNEAGDYIGMRPSIREPYNLLRILGPSIPRRRKFLQCVTVNSDATPVGQVGGVYVEWLEKTNPATGSQGTAGGWRPADELDPAAGQFQVLEKECGIRFDGQIPPFEIMVQGIADASVRVTATIEGDRRLLIQQLANFSLLKDTKIEVIDVPSRFKVRRRDPSSRFVGEPFIARAVNDEPAAARLSNQLLTSWNQASISGSVTLTGIDYDYSNVIGAMIVGVNGRNMDFNVSPTAPKYPSVIAARINIANQSLDLQLDTFRGEF